MRFIPKVKEPIVESVTVTEAEVNPLETNGVDLSYDEQYKQAILRAIGSETSAHVEYDQILALEPHVSTKALVDLFHDTLIDIRDEEMKHIAQLTTKISEVPEMKASFEAGEEEAETGEDKETSNQDETKEETEENEKEEVKESVELLTEAVQTNRLYDTYTISQIIADKLGLNDKQYEIIEDMFRYADDELEAGEVDSYLVKISEYFRISDHKLEEIENAIIASNDPIADRKSEFADDIQSDIYDIENTIEKVSSIAAKEKLYSVIEYLKNLEYNGEKEVGWSVRHSMFGSRNPKKRIVA